MAALRSRSYGHYIFALWFLLVSVFYLFPRLISAVADWMSTILLNMTWPYGNLECRSEMCCVRLARNAGRKKIAKNSPSGHHCTSLSGYIFATKACIDRQSEELLNSSISSTCLHNMVNFGPLTAEIGSGVWGTRANFNGFRILAALLHGTPVVGVSQTLRHSTEGATYIRQGGHHVGHRPTF